MEKLFYSWSLETSATPVTIKINQGKRINASDGDGFRIEIAGIMHPALRTRISRHGSLYVGPESNNPALMPMVLSLQEKIKIIIADALAHNGLGAQAIHPMNCDAISDFSITQFGLNHFCGAFCFQEDNESNLQKQRIGFFNEVKEKLQMMMPDLQKTIDDNKGLHIAELTDEGMERAAERYFKKAHNAVETVIKDQVARTKKDPFRN